MSCSLLTDTPSSGSPSVGHESRNYQRHLDHPENTKSTARQLAARQTLAGKYGPQSH